MRKSLKKREELLEKHSNIASMFKDFILGGQDGLVNVLGIVLGVAIGTRNSDIVILAGLAAAFAESVSMGAVAYTSSKAEVDYYKSEEKRELNEIKNSPETEKKEVYEIYHKKGFRGALLNKIVKYTISNKKRWLDTMMKEELELSNKFSHPLRSAFIVLFASLLGSFIPLTAFFFLSINTAIVVSLIIAAIALFITGAIEGKLTVGNWFKKGLQLMIIGMAAAFVGFIIGKFAGYSG